jgi:hypothetical protein
VIVPGRLPHQEAELVRELNGCVSLAVMDFIAGLTHVSTR